MNNFKDSVMFSAAALLLVVGQTQAVPLLTFGITDSSSGGFREMRVAMRNLLGQTLCMVTFDAQRLQLQIMGIMDFGAISVSNAQTRTRINITCHARHRRK